MEWLFKTKKVDLMCFSFINILPLVKLYKFGIKGHAEFNYAFINSRKCPIDANEALYPEDVRRVIKKIYTIATNPNLH